MVKFFLIEFLRVGKKKVDVGIRHRISASYRDGKRNKSSSSECQRKCNIVNLTISPRIMSRIFNANYAESDNAKMCHKKAFEPDSNAYHNATHFTESHLTHKIAFTFLLADLHRHRSVFWKLLTWEKVRSHHPVLVNEHWTCWSMYSFRQWKRTRLPKSKASFEKDIQFVDIVRMGAAQNYANGNGIKAKCH